MVGVLLYITKPTSFFQSADVGHQVCNGTEVNQVWHGIKVEYQVEILYMIQTRPKVKA